MSTQDSRESCIHTQMDADGVMTIWLDVPHKAVNTLTPQMFDELDALVSELDRRRDVRGVIIASSKASSFLAGADLNAVREMDHAGIDAYLRRGQAVMDRIAHLTIPTVAAINGKCLGGGYELTLACQHRVAANDPSIEIGLPEVKLGILPAWGGCLRLPRLIGLVAALPLLLTGKALTPAKAARIGMIDEAVRPEALMAAAHRLLQRKRKQRPPRWQRVIAAVPPSRRRLLDAARRRVQAKSFDHYPAPLRLIDAVNIGYAQGPIAGLQAEREALLSLLSTAAGRNLMRMFFLRQEARHVATDRLRARPIQVQHTAVLGGGVMGSGIAYSLAKAGWPVRLIDVNAKAMQAALRRIGGTFEGDVAAGRMTRLQADAAMRRISPSLQWTGLGLADIVIEAVIENLDAKREVFARLDKLTRPDAVLASNTSSLSITALAAEVGEPSRVIGLHFFNPVPIMPLVEAIRHPDSGDQAMATGLCVATRMGKAPVIARDAPGFIVNRVLAPYLAEAALMAAEGASIQMVDRAMLRWGMPMGPFELMDHIGMDIGLAVLDTLRPHLQGRMIIPDSLRQAVERGWLGRKSGRGFYVYGQRQWPWQRMHTWRDAVSLRTWTKPADMLVHDDMVHLLTSHEGSHIDMDSLIDEDVQWRLMLPMVNEGARLLDEGVTDSPEAVDLATVLGLGLAPFRGGLMHWADATGLVTIVRKMREHAMSFGPRFDPAASLVERSAAPSPTPQPTPDVIWTAWPQTASS